MRKKFIVRPFLQAIVIGLERLDTLLDHLPSYEDGKVYRDGLWGCRLRLAAYSTELDEKWDTGVWGTSVPD